jgi:hypothetical protein
MLKVSIEELSALNLVLQFTNVEELLTAAMKGFSEMHEVDQKQTTIEKSDLCWKVLKTLK